MTRRITAVIISLVSVLAMCWPQLVSAHGGIANGGLLQLSEEQRRAVVRAAFGEVLTEAQQQKISASCAAAQTKLEAYLAESQKIADPDTTPHAAIISKMGSLQALFSVSNIDDQAFKQAVIDYSLQLDSYKQAYEVHHIFVKEAIAMDCAASPTDFQAFVNGIRATRDEIDIHRTDIRTLVETTARPAVNNLLKAIAGEPQ